MWAGARSANDGSTRALGQPRVQALSEALARALSNDEVAQAAFELLLPTTGAVAGMLLLLRSEPGGDALELIGASGYAEASLTAYQRISVEAPTPAAEAVRTKKPVWIASQERTSEDAPRALAALPLLVEDRAVGALVVGFNEGHEFQADERALLTAAAIQCAIALQRATTFARERSGRERVELALGAARMGTWEWNLRTDRVDWSPELEAIHGFPPGAFGSGLEAYFAHLHREDAERVRAGIEASLQTGELHLEYRGIAPNGDERWFEARGHLTRGATGDAIALRGVCMDITERKQAEEALLESEERFRTLADNIAPFAWMADAQGRIFWYSQRWYEYTGTTPQDMQGSGWTKVHHPEHVNRVIDGLKRSWETGEPWEDTFPLRGQAGQYRWFLSRALPIRDERGRIERWLGTHTDITESRWTSALLEGERNALEMIALGSPASEVLAELCRTVQDVADDGLHVSMYVLDADGVHLRYAAGAELPLEGAAWSTPIRALNGTVLGTFALSYDEPRTPTAEHMRLAPLVGRTAAIVIERERADETRARLAAIVDSSDDEVTGKTLEGIVTSWNPAAVRMYGYTAEERIGRSITEIIPPAQLEEHSEIMARVARGQRVPAWDTARLHKDGHPVEVSLSLSPIRDEAGKVTGVSAIGRDVRERRRLEAERDRLLESERAAREQAEAAGRRLSVQFSVAAMLAGSTPDETPQLLPAICSTLGWDWGALWWVDADAGVLRRAEVCESNPGALAAFEAASRELRLAPGEGLLGRVWQSGEPVWVVDLMREAGFTYAALARDAGLQSGVVLPLRVGQGIVGVLSFYSRERRSRDPEMLATLIGIGRQLGQFLERQRAYAAEKAALAAAEAAINARDEFIAVVSHDLRNPLAAIKGQVQLVQRRVARGEMPTAAQLVKQLDGIQSSIGALSTQIDELHDATLLHAGRRLELRVSPTDLVELTRECVLRQQHTSELHRLRFESTVPELRGMWDAVRLERVLANLLSNAIKYSPSGGEVLVEVAREADSATVSVTDHGLGIPAADLPHVFERFRRASNVGRLIAGSGLGLAGARDIIEQHHGSISVQSEEGQGSTFVVRLPLTPD